MRTLIAILFVSLFSNIAFACKCSEFNLDHAFQSSVSVVLYKADSGAKKIGDTLYSTGIISEVFKGSHKPGNSILLDYAYGSSCEGASSFKAQVLVFAFEHENGIIRTSVCGMKAVEPITIGQEVFSPSQKHLDTLQKLREKLTAAMPLRTHLPCARV